MAKDIQLGKYISEGLNVYKSNLVPLFVGGLLAIVPGVQTNAIAQVLRFRATGEPITIGELFDFENALDKFLISLVGGFPLLPILSAPLLAEHPGLSFVNAWKVGWAYGMTQVGGMILLALAASGVGLAGLVGCCIGVVATVPAIIPILAVAYEDLRDDVIAAATEAGIELPPAVVYE